MDDLISRAAATRAAVISVRDYLGNIDSERDIHIEEGLYEMPAVDAIPVEWLEDKELDYRTIGDKMFSDAFAVVISEWQKEQEAR